MTISRRLARSFRWSGLATAGLAVLAYLQLAILVRRLDVADFAEFALAAVFINLGFQLQEGGLNAIVLQERSLSPGQLSTLFWLNLAFSLLLFLLISLPAGVIAAFYDLPQLDTTILALALLFPINAFRLQYKTLLQKQLRFKALTLAEGVASGGGMITAVLLAYRGGGVWSLVGGYAVRVILEAGLYYRSARRYFRPDGFFSLKEVHSFFRLASAHWLERLITHLVYQLDILLIGKWLGADQLGIYEVFKRVLMRPANMLAAATERVAWPVLARLAGRISRLQAFYQQTVNGLLSGLLLVYVPVFFIAGWFISWFFGPQWTQHSPLFRIMILFTLLLSAIQLCDSYLLVLRKIHWWTAAGLVLAVLWTAAIAAGRPYGLLQSLQYLTLGQACFSLLAAPLLIARAGKQATHFVYFLLPLGLAGSAAAVAFFAARLFPAAGFRPFAALLFFLVFYGLLQYLFNRKTVHLALELLLKKTRL